MREKGCKDRAPRIAYIPTAFEHNSSIGYSDCLEADMNGADRKKDFTIGFFIGLSAFGTVAAVLLALFMT